MPIFKIDGSKLTLIKESRVDLEKYLQTLTEKNLQTIFGLEFVSGSLNNEFCVKGAQQDFYIDTLAFDPEAKSFVIIEYKKDKAFSVIDQGYAYLGAMLNNQADFVLEYNEKKKANLKKSDIDWRQSKIIFISPQFTVYQQSAIAFKDLPIELWKVSLYENNTILYEQVKPPVARESIGTIAPKSKIIEQVSKEIKPYTLEEIFRRRKTSPRMKDLLNKLREEIPRFGEDIKEAFGKWSVIYRKQGKTFAYLHPRTNEIHGDLRINEIKTSTKIGFKRKVKEEDEYKIAFKIRSEDQLNDALNLIKEAYENLAFG
jgi:predicted transport protein